MDRAHDSESTKTKRQRRLQHTILRCLLVVLATATGGCALSERPYRQLALSRGLRHDGWIIGIEQANREESSAPKAGAHDSDRFKPESLPWDETTIRSIRAKAGYARTAEDEKRLEEQEVVLLRNEIFQDYAKTKKISLVTQVYESFKPATIDTARYATVDIFNAHDLDGSGVIGETQFHYADSFRALEIFRRRFKQKLAEGNHTHVILLALGWHVDQVEAIHTYNLMLHHLCEESDGAFRPLVVGITWPSAWLQGLIQPLDLIGHIFSYFDKAKDADAIGATIAAHLLYDILLDKENPLPVVAIGHSMGARMLSRAYFSARNLVNAKPHKKLSLLICLQGAFSANRFLKQDTDEGHPYDQFAAKRAEIVLTTSTFDLANAAARILTTFPNVGGQYGLKVAQEHPETFRILHWPASTAGTPRPTTSEIFPHKNKRVLMIDAETIVNGGTGGLHGKNVRPHNDFLDAEMGQLMWTLIKSACEK